MDLEMRLLVKDMLILIPLSSNVNKFLFLQVFNNTEQSQSLICCHSYNWEIVPPCCLILFSWVMMLKISFSYFVGHCHFLFYRLSICISSTFPCDSVLLICIFLCILGKNPLLSYMIYRCFLPIWGRCYFVFPLQVELWCHIISWCH